MTNQNPIIFIHNYFPHNLTASKVLQPLENGFLELKTMFFCCFSVSTGHLLDVVTFDVAKAMGKIIIYLESVESSKYIRTKNEDCSTK